LKAVGSLVGHELAKKAEGLKGVSSYVSLAQKGDIENTRVLQMRFDKIQVDRWHNDGPGRLTLVHNFASRP
jgi:hypothetical protein